MSRVQQRRHLPRLVAWCVIGAFVCAAPVGAWAASGPDVASIRVETGKSDQAKGTALLVNGKEIGPLPIELSLQTGRYLIEVQKDGHETWRRWLDVAAGQATRLEVDLVAKAAPPAQRPAKDAATLVVASDVLEAEVLVDGRSVGRVPALISGLEPGRHEVVVSCQGRQTHREEVTLSAGQTLKLRVRLAVAADPAGGAVAPQAPQAPPQAEPTQGTGAPGAAEGAGPEATRDTVREGADPWGEAPPSSGAETAAGAAATADAARVPAAAPQGTLIVHSSVPGATVQLSGKAIGTTPLEREVLAGVHVVTVRSERFEDFVVSLEIKPAQVVTVRAELQPRAASTPQQLERVAPAPADTDYQAATRSLTAHTAYLVDPTYVTADFSFGFPHIVEARLTTGFFDQGFLAMDGGVDLRTYGAMTEVGLRARLRVLEYGPWALATPIAIGGGGGAKARSTFFFDAGLLGSVLVAKRFHISAGTRLQVYSDRLCPSSVSPNEMEACSVPPEGVTPAQVRERFSGVRVMFSSNLEVPITSWMNLFGAIEFAPFQGNRRAYSNDFASIMPGSDPGFYGRLGLTIKR